MFDPIRPSKATQRRSLELSGRLLTDCVIGALWFFLGVAICIALPVTIGVLLFVTAP
jgi:hypothetical protein